MQNVKRLFIAEIRQTLFLALPLIAAALAQMGIEVVDTVMMGRLGPKALAAGSLGAAIFMFLIVIGIGVITSLGVMVARAYGARRLKRMAQIMRQGFWLVIMWGLPGMLVLWFSPHFLLKIGEEPAVVAGTTAFLHAEVWGFLPAIGFFALREFVSALSRPRIVMIIAVIDIPIAAIANYILMYGKLGFPALGIAGIGYATSLVEWLSLLALIFYITWHPHFRRYRICQQIDKLQSKIIKELLQLGWPVGVLYGLEAGLFSIATLLMGLFGPAALAAHQIALQSLSVAFMPSLGISQAAAVRVSQESGAGNFVKAKRAAHVSIFIGVIIAIIAACGFWLIPEAIIALFINLHAPQNQPVVKLAIMFLSICAVFELMDALQVIVTGILRGLKDTFMPMLLGLMSYWITGLGASYLLAFVFKLDGIGIWWGLAIGITVSALLLIWRFKTSIDARVLREKN